MSSAGVNFWDMPDLLYRVKSFEANRYVVEHPSVNGIIKIATMPTDVLHVDPTKLPANIPFDPMNPYIVGSRSVVTFVNRKKKQRPTDVPDPANMHKYKKAALLGHIVAEQTLEPWNEYVVEGEPPKILRIRTIMTNAYWYPDFVTPTGNPLVRLQYNTSISVTDAAAPETGMT